MDMSLALLPARSQATLCMTHRECRGKASPALKQDDQHVEERAAAPGECSTVVFVARAYGTLHRRIWEGSDLDLLSCSLTTHDRTMLKIMWYH